MHNVELYTKNNYYQKFIARRFYNFFGDFLKTEYESQEISLIDVGSGCGTILSEVTVGESGLKFAKVLGIDISDKMVKFSNETYGSELMSFRYMDAMASIPDDFSGVQFNMATSFNVFHFFNDLKKALKTINDLMVVNGTLGCVFFIWHRYLDAWDALIEKYPIMTNWRSHFTPLSLVDNPDEVLKKYLKETGFEIVEFIDVKNEVYNCVLPENMANTLDAVNPFFTMMSEEQQQQFSKDQISKIFELQGSDSLVEPFRNIYFIARKVHSCSTD
ncbi:unnamed protein product [Chironomus riparius]|uniref:Methyltransferase type 11 domain-containing protein n=1 Tax=Chironomus riparius TaxID=315576 RepID=A0A9N9S7H1_9DIPT|nr:unnamed protein product [Chironomus riparius]